MATLKAHGGALGTLARLKFNRAYCADGCVLDNWGHGWKLRARLRKDCGKTPAQVWEEARAAFQAKLDTRPAFAEWLRLVHESAPLHWRALLVEGVGLLVEGVGLLPGDADGLKAEMEDAGMLLTLDECLDLCRAYRAALAEAEAADAAKAAAQPATAPAPAPA
jgi:hypothetical protein